MSQPYRIVIGLEVHVQLLTRTKLFCGCSTEFGLPPNSATCPVCAGLPGALPVMNRRAFELAVKAALALNCEIAPYTKWDRKNYYYPDLPKNYQISQYDLPFSTGGWLEIPAQKDGSGGGRCRLTRVHLEEDTGKLLHEGAIHEAQASLVNFNRAGVPLMEIVSDPDLRSADEAREYVMRLRAILQYIGVNDGDMESGQLRCDANVSLRPAGSAELGTKVEIKNMNSFRAIHRAIEYEIERQSEVLGSGGRLAQETRGWNDARALTVSQRSKEFAEDYRYFPEPDLPPLDVSREWVAEIRSGLPELPAARRDRLITTLGLTPYDASLLTSSKPMVEFFEETVRLGAPAKTAANWILGDFSRLLNADRKEIDQASVKPEHLQQLISLIDSGAITGRMAKQTFEAMYRAPDPSAALQAARGSTQISGDAELDRIVEQVIAENGKSVADFKAGKEQALKFLIGQGMKISKGRANPQRLDTLLREKI